MTLESFSDKPLDSEESKDKSTGYPELDLSDPNAFFDELSGGLDSLISNDATPIYLYERLSGLFERLPEDFRTQNNIPTLQDFLLRINFVYNPENVIQGEFDGVNVDLGFQQMDNEQFQGMLENFNYFVENFDLSESNVYSVENKIILTPKNPDVTLEYIQTVIVTPDTLFQINNNLLFTKNRLANQIIDSLDLPSDTTFESAFETLFSLKHLYYELYDQISQEISSKIFFKDLISLKSGVRIRQSYDLSVIGSRLFSRQNITEFNSNGLKVRFTDSQHDSTHEYFYNSDNQLERTIIRRGSNVIENLYYERQGNESVLVRREVPTTTDVLLGYSFAESLTGVSRYLLLENGLKIASFQHMQAENSDLTKADYYQLLADNINTDNYQYFYDHLFRYTSDEIEWTNQEGLIISGEHWQFPDETLCRVDRGQMLGDCDDIAFLMHNLATMNSNVEQTFVIGITRHAINVTSRIENGEYVLTRFGTFGSREFRGETFFDAINLLLSTYDRGGEGRGTPVLDRVNSQITLLTRRGSDLMWVKVPIEMLMYINNSDYVQDIINTLGFTDIRTEISLITNETCVYNNYFFDLPKLDIPNYLESIKYTSDSLNDAFLESTMVDAFVQFEEFVKASGSDLSFENDRMNFVKLLIDEHSSNDAENVLEALSERYPRVSVYSEAYVFLTSDSRETLGNNIFANLEKFKQSPTLETLTSLVPNEGINSSFLLQIEDVLYRNLNLDLYTYYITFYPSRLNLKELLRFSGQLPEDTKDIVFDSVNNYLSGLNQDSQWDVQNAIETVCKFMPERFSNALDSFVRQLSHTTLPLIVARLDLSSLNICISQYSSSLDENVFRDFQCLVHLMLQDFDSLYQLLSESFFQNENLFRYCIQIITQNRGLSYKMLFFVEYFRSNQSHAMLDLFCEVCEHSYSKNEYVNAQVQEFIASLESR